MGKRKGEYRVLLGKPVGKRPLGRPRCRWDDNIKMDFQVVGYGGVGWIDLTQDRDRCRALVNAVLNLRVSFFLISNQRTRYSINCCAGWLEVLTCRLTSMVRSPPARRSRKFNHN